MKHPVLLLCAALFVNAALADSNPTAAASDAAANSPAEANPINPALPTIFIAGDSTAARGGEVLGRETDRLRNGAHAVTDEATRYGSEALRRIEDEVEQRPLLTLAIAAGIGFLAGMAGRRH